MKDKLISIDASVLISSFVFDEEKHPVSKKLLEQLPKSNLIIALSIHGLFECLHAYFRKTKDATKTKQLLEIIMDWSATGRLKIIPQEAEFFAFFNKTHHFFDIKTADAVMAITALKLKCPLITWDKKLIKAARPHLEAMTPKQFLTTLKT